MGEKIRTKIRTRSFYVELLELPIDPKFKARPVPGMASFEVPKRELVVSCLRCGHRESLSPLHYNFDPGVFSRHKCDEIDEDLAALEIEITHGQVENFSWRTVVRDAFLEGRDDEAINLICNELGLVAI